MKLDKRLIPILFFVAAAIMALPRGNGGLSVVPQPISISVVESSLSGTMASDAVLNAIQKYADESQEGRYRKYDFETTRDRNGKIPAGVEDIYADFGTHSTDGRRLYLRAKATGKVILACQLPSDVQSAVALLKKYGG